MKQQEGVISILTDLKPCSIRGDLQWGRKIHTKVVESRNDKNIYVAAALINMYAKCGSMVDARDVFDSIKKPDVVSWTAMLLGYADTGDGLVVLELFSRMKTCGCAPNAVTYVAALKACTLLAVNGNVHECRERGKEIHLQIGCHLDHYVQSTLIGMYSACGSMVDACAVFDSVQKPDVVCWNALLLGYAENGAGLAALETFSRMKACGCMPSSVTYLAALKACISLAVNGDGNGKEACLKRGRKLHSQIACCHLSYKVQSTLVDMYAKCSSMVDARVVFDNVKEPNVVFWNTMLLGYVANGNGLVALEMFSRMKERRCVPNSVTYIAALKACGLVGALTVGRKFHLEIRHEICELDTHLVTCLVDFYAKCGSMVEARGVFDLHSKTRDAAIWTALLAGYSNLGDTDSVFELFEVMQDEGLQPDGVTFICILSCCSHAGLVEKGKEFFEDMLLKYRVTPTVMHYNCMVDILGRANRLSEAIAMIQKMPCDPNAVTWTALLGGCCKWKNVNIGRLAFQSLVDIDNKDAFAYVIMAHIYGSVCMWEEQERVLETRIQLGAWGQAYVMNGKL